MGQHFVLDQQLSNILRLQHRVATGQLSESLAASQAGLGVGEFRDFQRPQQFLQPSESEIQAAKDSGQDFRTLQGAACGRAGQPPCFGSAGGGGSINDQFSAEGALASVFSEGPESGQIGTGDVGAGLGDGGGGETTGGGTGDGTSPFIPKEFNPSAFQPSDFGPASVFSPRNLSPGAGASGGGGGEQVGGGPTFNPIGFTPQDELRDLKNPPRIGPIPIPQGPRNFSPFVDFPDAGVGRKRLTGQLVRPAIASPADASGSRNRTTKPFSTLDPRRQAPGDPVKKRLLGELVR